MPHVLTPTQYECARLAATGLPRAEIARRMGVSLHSVSSVLDRAYKRLNIRSRRQIAPLLLECRVGSAKYQPKSRLGVVAGDSVRITGGRYGGHVGTYVRAHNSTQICIQVRGAAILAARKYVEPVKEA